MYRRTLACASAGHWSRLASKDPVDPESWGSGTGSRLHHRVGVFSGRSGEEVDRTGAAGTGLVGLEPEHPRLTRVSSRVESSSVPGMAQPEANRTQHRALTWRSQAPRGDRYRACFRVSVCRPGTVPAWDSQPLWRMPAHLVDNSCHVSTTAAVWCGRVSGSLWSIGGGRWSCAGGAPVSPTVGPRSSASFHTDVPRFSPAAKAIYHFSTLSSARRL